MPLCESSRTYPMSNSRLFFLFGRRGLFLTSDNPQGCFYSYQLFSKCRFQSLSQISRYHDPALAAIDC